MRLFSTYTFHRSVRMNGGELTTLITNSPHHDRTPPERRVRARRERPGGKHHCTSSPSPLYPFIVHNTPLYRKSAPGTSPIPPNPPPSSSSRSTNNPRKNAPQQKASCGSSAVSPSRTSLSMPLREIRPSNSQRRSTKGTRPV